MKFFGKLDEKKDLEVAAGKWPEQQEVIGNYMHASDS
jgi:hypothetical protein